MILNPSLPGLSMPHVSTAQTRVTATRAASPDSVDMGSRADMRYAALSGYTENMTGSERIFVGSSKGRPKSPKRKRSGALSVNRRPYSASSSTGGLDKSPYKACVAPHIHYPKTRPASAKKLMHFV